MYTIFSINTETLTYSDINTNTLTYSDINDFYKQNTKGHNFNTSIGSDKTDNKQLNLHPQGSTTIGLINQSEEKEQITRATVGNGNITIRNNDNNNDNNNNNNNNNNLNLIRDLNRNVNNSQEITKDITSGVLNNSMTIDNRLFTEGGRENIGDELWNINKNLGQSLKNLTKNNIVVQSIKNAYTDDTKNIIDVVNDYINDTNKLKDIQDDNNLTNKLNGLTNFDAEDVKDTMQHVVDIASQDGGFNGEVNLYDIDEQTKGYAYSNGENDNHIGFNTNTNDLTNSNDVINTLFHETTNQEQHNKNEQTALNRGNTAEAIWDMLNYGNKNTNSKENITSKGKVWNQKNSDSSVITKGNLNRINDYSNYYQENIKNNNKNVKLDELTVFVHGTFSNPDTFTPEFKESIKRLTGDEK